MNINTNKIYALIFRRMWLFIAMIASGVSILAFMTPLLGKNLTPYLLGVVASGLGATIVVAIVTTMGFIFNRTRVFVCYAHADSDFVIALADGLKSLNAVPLIDRFELNVGDDIRTAVDNMIDRADCFIFVVSEASSKSDWAKKELNRAMERKKKVLPVMLSVEALPDALSGVFYADFTGDFQIGLDQLKKTFEKGGVKHPRGRTN